MKADILVIGAGASGLMAAYSAADTLCSLDSDAQVVLLEKMPRSGRKLMITGKGRCNFTNLKSWGDFSTHIRSGRSALRSAFHTFPPQKLIDFFASYGMDSVVERGDRAFPASYRASDVVDTLVSACLSKGVKIVYETTVTSVQAEGNRSFKVTCGEDGVYLSKSLIVATGGLSYPSTGSSGDGYLWACGAGHKLTPTFPSLTAMVPSGYKLSESGEPICSVPCADGVKGHIDRSRPLAPLGGKLCGVTLKNVAATLLVQGTEAASEFGDIDFTDGGLEGPVGFQMSRKAVKSILNGSRVEVVLDLKPGVGLTELVERVRTLWGEVDADARSARLHEKEKCRIMLGKLLPWELIPAFWAMNPGITTLQRRSRTETKLWVNIVPIAKALKEWHFPIVGYVGYERAVVTAGGVCLDGILPKTMESRLVQGLFFCGEILDIDCDTGGYNLQCAFCSGALAGRCAAFGITQKN